MAGAEKGITGLTYLLFPVNIVRCAFEMNATKRKKRVRSFFINNFFKTF